MKWIYSMVEDGSYSVFKKMYKIAKHNGRDAFIWEGRSFSVILAEAVIKIGDKAVKDYDKYIDDMAEQYCEWQAEIARGK